ncbi:MAG: UDP-N-acetylglucosamine diphosphorylase/glucosamine-1-phosphate N-acetyltransferase [Deltaproteobacteria bacterium]|nr:UDP-N-acetylglucosamine diphosphorylase/glucosamine-1-phosphate N-acetyltransferase [Deltaproteobacteria bacterium]
MKNVTAMVLAGGRGVRMHSASTKMLMPILGRPMVVFPAAIAVECVDGPVVVVSGEYLPDVEAAVRASLPAEPRFRFARQDQPLGTADAVRAGLVALEGVEGWLLILNGDVPALTRGLICRLEKLAEERKADVAFVGFRTAEPFGYGRVLFDDSGVIQAIREQKELKEEEKSLDIVNAGIYLVKLAYLRDFLGQVKPAEHQREYLLTDLVEHVVSGGGLAEMLLVRDAGEVEGVNNRAELASVTHRIRSERNHALMLAGVGMPHPESVDVEFGVEVGPDVLLEANVALRGRTKVAPGCRIGDGSILEDTQLAEGVKVLPYCVLESSEIGPGCAVGPFAHTRPGTVLRKGARIGNFVETKKTVLGEGSKANHLSYLGDADIGKAVNVGAGTITCNYDGYSKFKTVIEDGVFIGSDTQLVAPVTVGREAVIAAGTTVTHDVPAGALAISRVDQANREGYSAQRKLRKAKKDGK